MQPPSQLSPTAKAIEAQLKALCPMRHQCFIFSDKSYTIWTACDIDPLLNALVDKEDNHPDILDERMPYWAELWPSSLLLAQTILDRKEQLPSSGKWLELGCGPALPGIVAASLKLKGVCSDYMQEALWLARLNAEQNDCVEYIHFQELDWRHPQETQKFSWILAGDVAYEERNFQPLLETFEHYLSNDGEIWLGEPGRRLSENFFSLMASEGWVSDLLSQQKEMKVHRFRKSKKA